MRNLKEKTVSEKTKPASIFGRTAKLYDLLVDADLRKRAGYKSRKEVWRKMLTLKK